MSYVFTMLAIITVTLVLDKSYKAYCKKRELDLFERRIKIDTLKLINKQELMKMKDQKTPEGYDAFESWCAGLLKTMGYNYVMVTEAVADGGKDIIAEKDGIEYYAECKLWHEDNLVGRPVIQKLVGACYHDKVTRGIVITSSSYSQEAIDYAKTLPQGIQVELIDGDELVLILHNQRAKFIEEHPVLDPVL